MESIHSRILTPMSVPLTEANTPPNGGSVTRSTSSSSFLRRRATPETLSPGSIPRIRGSGSSDNLTTIHRAHAFL